MARSRARHRLLTQLYLTEDTAAAATRWRELQRELGDVPLACSWDWTELWLRHYGDAVEHRFAVLEDEGRTRGMALVCERDVRKGPFRLRRAHLGTAGEPEGESIDVEYNGLLCEPATRRDFASELRAAARSERWDEIALDGFSAADAEPFGRLSAERREPCPLARLADDDVLAALRTETRRRVRRGMRGFGELESSWADGPEEALDVFGELVDLHERRWREAGEPGAFASDRALGLHRDLIARLVPAGRALLFRVRAGATTVGCLYSFVDRDRVLFYQSGFGEFADNKLRPGLVTHVLCMQACRERGLTEYNFLAGDARYKRELSNAEDVLVWGAVTRPTAKMRAIHGLRRAKREVS